MATITKERAIKALLAKNTGCFGAVQAGKLFSINNSNTLYKLLQRLEKAEIIKRIRAGKYIFLLNRPLEFELANFMVSPSYISCESALSFYGMLPQFSYSITSLTLAKPAAIIFEGKEYEYSHIDRKYFFGFEKALDNKTSRPFLIASREKAFLDLLYLVSKGQRKLSRDELDLSGVNKKVLKNMAGNFKFTPLAKIVRKYVE